MRQNKTKRMKWAAIGIGLAVALPGFAEDDVHYEDMSLEELLNVKIVSATRQENTALHLPAMVTTLTRQELEQWGSENLADALRQASGVLIRRSPGNFPVYSASIRGNTSDFLNERTLFLIDGVPVFNPNGGFDPEWIPLTMIKRVEIVKGPISSLYGANAFGGVINVITRSGADLDGRLGRATGGARVREDKTSDRKIPGYSGSVEHGQPTGSWDYYAAAEAHRDNDSSTNYTGRTYQDVFGKASYQANDRLSFGLTTLVSRDRDPIAVTKAPNPIRNGFTHVAASAKLKTSDASDLQITGYLNDFSHEINYSDGTHYENEGKALGLNTQYSTPLGSDHAFLTGIEYTRASGSLDPGWNERKQNQYGIYAQDQYKGFGSFLPVVGVRYDHNSEYGSAFSPRAGLSYLLSPNATLYASAGRAFRAPVFNESYISSFGKVGNPGLQPELTTTYEVGVKTVYQNTQNTVAVFRQDISRKIDLVPIGSGLSEYRNGGTASIWGVEWEGSARVFRTLRPFYNLTLLDTDDGHDGGTLSRTVGRKIVAGTAWDFLAWEFKYVLIHEGRLINKDTGTAVVLPSVTTMNVQAVTHFGKDVDFTLFVDNFTNRRYRETYSAFIDQNAAWLPGISAGFRLGVKF